MTVYAIPEFDSIAILCACERDHTTHVRVEYYERGILLEFGKLNAITGFQALYSENIFFFDAPELRDLVKEGRWQWDELWMLIEQVADGDVGTPIHRFRDHSDVWHLFRVAL